MTNSDYDIDWAKVIDTLAKEYGWTIDYIKSLDLGQITKLLRVIRNRYEKQSDEDNSSEDLVKENNKELSMSDFKAMGGKVGLREDGRTEIII